MKILPRPGAGKTQPLFLLLGLAAFVLLPFLLIRQVVWTAVRFDEERLLDEYRRAMKSEMEAFIQEATPEYQLRKALNRALRGLPKPGGRDSPTLDAAWAERFRKRLKRTLPFAPADLWIFGPALEPLVIEGTPPENRKKAPFLYAYFSGLGSYAVRHPEFLDRLRGSFPGNAYLASQISELLRNDPDPLLRNAVENEVSRRVAAVWGKFNLPFSLRADFRRAAEWGNPDRFPLVTPIAGKDGKRFLAFQQWRDRDGKPLGGVLISFPAPRVTAPWVLAETCRNTLHAELVRRWSPYRPGRRQRQWINDRRGLHWIDLPAQLPEYQIRVSLPAARVAHPFRAHLGRLDAALGLSTALLLSVTILCLQRGFQVPLRIHGQLNAALCLAGLLPFIVFATVAFSYVSMKTSLERRICLRQAENGLGELEAHHRAYLELVLKRFRKMRDRLRQCLDDRGRIAPFLKNLLERRIISDCFVQLGGGYEYSSEKPGDKDNVTASLMSGLVAPLFAEVIPGGGGEPPAKSPGSKALKRSLMAETLLPMLLSPQHYCTLMVNLDRLHPLNFGISNPAYVFLDILTSPKTGAPAGVAFFATTAHATFDHFLLRNMFRGGTSPSRVLGLDRLIVRGFATAESACFPPRTPLTALERELFEQVLGSRDRVVRDDFDGSDGGFIAAAPIRDANYIMIGRVDGRRIRAHIKTLEIGVWAILGYGFLVMIGIGSFLSGKFAFPLLTLREATEAVERDDLEIRLEIPSRDEFGELAAGFNRMTAGLRERSRISRFVSASLLETVKREDQGDREAVCRTDVTVLFSDLRGFTSLSEQYDAATIVDLLNDYFTAMEEPILRHGGDIDKYVGDAIMAVFRARSGEPPLQHAVHACRAALGMREVLTAFNADRKARGLFPVDNGIGINTGEVISGHVGSRHGRLDHTVIGDTVNLAARLESESKRGTTTHILISASTREVLGPLGTVTSLDRVTVKGKDRPVEIFELLGIIE